MSDYNDDEFENDQNESDEKKNPLRPVLKQKEKALNEALAELAKYRAQERSSTVAELIKEAGGDPRYAKFYVSEDASPETVKAWIQSESELLGIKPPEQADPQDEQVRLLTDAVNSAPQVRIGSTADLVEKMRTAKTPEEFQAALSSAFPRT